MLTLKEINIIITTFEPYLPQKIGVFGSTARNQNTETSDLDILYSLKHPISLFTVAKLQILLEKQLGKKIDLVSEEALHPKLKNSILEDLKVLYAA